MKTVSITDDQMNKIINVEESHFADLKSIDVTPGKLTRTVSALANADGGEIYVGIEDKPREWRGFSSIKSANGHIQIFEKLFPMGHGFSYSFLTAENAPGYVLKIEILKSLNVIIASDKKPYLRRSAQNLPQNEPTVLNRLKQNKGIVSFENELVNVEKELILESDTIREFIKEVVPTSTPEKWLKKQRLILSERPSVGGVILFCDEPQTILPKRTGVKLYRYRSKQEEGERAVLDFQPITIEGNAYNLIDKAVRNTVTIIEEVKVMTDVPLALYDVPLAL